MSRYLCLFFLLFPAELFAQNAGDVVTINKGIKDTSQQKDLIDVAKEILHLTPPKIEEKKEKKVYFSFVPTGAAVPGGTGRALLTSTTAGMYFGPRSTTNISTATFAPYWNLHDRYGLPLRTSIWLPNNAWTIQGDTRFLVYPQYTWGLGSGQNHNDKTLVDDNYIRFYQSVLKRIRPSLFAGLGYNLDYHANIKSDDPNVNLQEFTNYPYGTNGNSVSSGLSINLLYDTRTNNSSPFLPGAYTNIVYRVNPVFLGSNNYWNSLYVDVRKYLSLNPSKPNQQNTLAFWSYFWTVFNSNAPYLDLPSIGWDPYNRSGEGIEQSRYRGKSLFYAQSEYRRDMTNNGLFGFVVFANVNTVSGSGTLFTSWHPAAGTGLRIKFNKGSNTNIVIDYAASQGYHAIFFNLGEAF